MPYHDIQSPYFKTLHRIHPPKITRVLAVALLLLTLIAVAFLTFVPWVQTAPGVGSITALNPNDRAQEINALVSGRIQKWYVGDGSRVRAGDPIVKVVDNDPQLLDRLNSERQQVLAKLQAAETSLDIANIDRERMKGLFDDGLAARRDYEQARLKVEEQRAKVAETLAEVTRLDVNLSRQSVQIVRAPRDGVILNLNAGDTATLVSIGDSLATFVPDDVERVLEMYIAGSDVALVSPGAPVRIQFDGWPILQVSGWPSQSIGTFAGTVVAIDPSASLDGRFRLLVAEDKSAEHPWPDARFVRFGSKARGWVLLEQVSVGYEIWRQLNSFPPQLPKNPIEEG